MELRPLFEFVSVLRAPPTEKLFFEPAQVVDEKNPIEVIHLVLNTECRELFRFDLKEVAVAIVRRNGDGLEPLNRVAIIWNA